MEEDKGGVDSHVHTKEEDPPVKTAVENKSQDVSSDNGAKVESEMSLGQTRETKHNEKSNNSETSNKLEIKEKSVGPSGDSEAHESKHGADLSHVHTKEEDLYTDQQEKISSQPSNTENDPQSKQNQPVKTVVENESKVVTSDKGDEQKSKMSFEPQRANVASESDKTMDENKDVQSDKGSEKQPEPDLGQTRETKHNEKSNNSETSNKPEKEKSVGPSGDSEAHESKHGADLSHVHTKEEDLLAPVKTAVENKGQDVSSDNGAEQKSEMSFEQETVKVASKRDKTTSEDQDVQSGDGDEKQPEPDLEHSKEIQQEISVSWNDKLLWICPVVVLLIAVVLGFHHGLSDSSRPVPKQFNAVEVFNQEMEKLKTSFPNQHPELWRRSLIHLRRHLKTEQPTEPVSVILSSGYAAERTLGCLAQCLAQAFSIARNSSVLNINGKSKSSQDSDQVKMDIDSELKLAFGGRKFAAVIHRFEELPPGSTLIFYRYCDHENAAFKNVFLAFTIMLDDVAQVPSNVNLGEVEDMVYDHLKQKFVSSGKTATFNQMDVDKLSGLWSRISHLILPVAAEKTIEEQGCGRCDESF